MFPPMTSPVRQSPLHDRHVSLGAKFSRFGGWEMPLEYAGGGVLKEHAAVREAVGVFDVTHLGKVSVRGPGAAEFLNRCLTNDLDRIGAGPAHPRLAEVRHVEDPGTGTHGGVLLDDAAARVLQRHLPAAELGELRTEGQVPVMQWRAQEHGSQLTCDLGGG